MTETIFDEMLVYAHYPYSYCDPLQLSLEDSPMMNPSYNPFDIDVDEPKSDLYCHEEKLERNMKQIKKQINLPVTGSKCRSTHNEKCHSCKVNRANFTCCSVCRLRWCTRCAEYIPQWCPTKENSICGVCLGKCRCRSCMRIGPPTYYAQCNISYIIDPDGWMKDFSKSYNMAREKLGLFEFKFIGRKASELPI